MIFKSIRWSLTSRDWITGLAFGWRYSYETLFLIRQNEKRASQGNHLAVQYTSPTKLVQYHQMIQRIAKTFLIKSRLVSNNCGWHYRVSFFYLDQIALLILLEHKKTHWRGLFSIDFNYRLLTKFSRHGS